MSFKKKNCDENTIDQKKKKRKIQPIRKRNMKFVHKGPGKLIKKPMNSF